LWKAKEYIGCELNYQQIPIEAQRQAMMQFGMGESVANAYALFFEKMLSGQMAEEAIRTPENTTKTPFSAFAQQFGYAVKAAMENQPAQNKSTPCLFTPYALRRRTSIGPSTRSCMRFLVWPFSIAEGSFFLGQYH
jgi:hypothetical protein